MADDLVRLPPSQPEQLAAYVAEFEAYFQRRQREHGLEGAPLTRLERGAIAAFIAWQRRRNEEQDGTHDQAQ